MESWQHEWYHCMNKLEKKNRPKPATTASQKLRTRNKTWHSRLAEEPWVVMWPRGGTAVTALWEWSISARWESDRGKRGHTAAGQCQPTIRPCHSDDKHIFVNGPWRAWRPRAYLLKAQLVHWCLKEPEASFKRQGVAEDAHVINLHITNEQFGSGSLAERVWNVNVSSGPTKSF